MKVLRESRAIAVVVFPASLLLAVLSVLNLSCGVPDGSDPLPNASPDELVRIDDRILLNPEAYRELGRLASSTEGAGHPLESTWLDDSLQKARFWADQTSRGESLLILGDADEKRIKVSGFPTTGFRRRGFTDAQYASLAEDFLLSRGLIQETADDRIGQMSVHELAALDGEDGTRKVEEIFVAAYRFVREMRAFSSNAIVRLDPETGTVRGFNIKNWLPVDRESLSRYPVKDLRTLLIEIVRRLREERARTTDGWIVLENCAQGWSVSGEMLLPSVDCTGYLTPGGDTEEGALPRGVFVNVPLLLGPWTVPPEEDDSPQGDFPLLEVISMSSPDASETMDRTANGFLDAWNLLYGTGRSVHLDSNHGDGDHEEGTVRRELLAGNPESPEEQSLHPDTFDVSFLESHGCADLTGREQSHCVSLGQEEKGNDAGRLYASGSRQDRLAPLGRHQLKWAIFTASSFLTSYTADLPCSDCGPGQDTRYRWEKEWSGVFDGLHGVLGFTSATYFGNGSGAETVRDFVGYLRVYPVRWAWYEAVWDNWSSGEKPCCASTRNVRCDRRCNYRDHPDEDKHHCCPTVSRFFWNDRTAAWEERQVGVDVRETVVRPGFAGAMTIPRNHNEQLQKMGANCRKGQPCYAIRHSYMTGHQGCEVWKDDGN